MSVRPRVLMCCNSMVHDGYLVGEGRHRFDALADWDWLPSQGH